MIFMLSTKCRHIFKTVLSHRHRKLSLTLINATRTMVVLHADPSPALVDDKTKYTIDGLGAGQNVTVAALLKEGKWTFISHAHYTANSQGHVNMTQQPSLGGSYTGEKPMGLFWAMQPQKGSLAGIRLHKKDPTLPFNIVMSVLNGHNDIQSEEDVQNSTVLCSTPHPRTYMAPGVRRIMIREGRLRAALFLPPGDGPFPGVIDLFGTAGGLTEFRSALLASRGFASLALAYFDYDDLRSFMSWDMEYFEEAVDFMTTHPDVKPGGIGTIAVSKGTELISYMAIYSPLVKAVVSIGPYHYYSLAEHFKDGKKEPTVWPDWNDLTYEPEGLVADEAYLKVNVPEDALIQIEKAEGAEFLFINGEDDRLASPKHTDFLIERLERHGKHNYKLLRYPGAGHLLEPPYTPLSRAAYHKVVGQAMLFGGNTIDHAYAQEHCWNEILNFFKQRLNVEGSLTSKL